eukprot:CAMPEP_0173377654 /NCGR_PEP_ID=MMETSP1356-20130122/919_1 /TAXON_ID=77927 ORGANISM="Hemiselmis virescens, Strain PCC157" /NCGR_SAMPLE_ID=MMETSP1356 /ASSEMBLY_ACC=CAM_ASM_000847 /LENGTH=185 /DNA_ID=CAMNT_0014330475 /DNA_START=244 /DNA_END=798 /DNA_ORIENTATION=-
MTAISVDVGVPGLFGKSRVEALDVVVGPLEEALEKSLEHGASCNSAVPPPSTRSAASDSQYRAMVLGHCCVLRLYYLGPGMHPHSQSASHTHLHASRPPCSSHVLVLFETLQLGVVSVQQPRLCAAATRLGAVEALTDLPQDVLRQCCPPNMLSLTLCNNTMPVTLVNPRRREVEWANSISCRIV